MLSNFFFPLELPKAINVKVDKNSQTKVNS